MNVTMLLQKGVNMRSIKLYSEKPSFLAARLLAEQGLTEPTITERNCRAIHGIGQRTLTFNDA